MIGHLDENPPRFLGRREIKGQWREKWLNLAVRVRPKHLESEFHSSMIATLRVTARLVLDVVFLARRGPLSKPSAVGTPVTERPPGHRRRSPAPGSHRT
jgi:hypothetical protein